MRRRLALLAIIIASIVPAAAFPECWLGLGLAYDMNKISNDFKPYFTAYNNGDISMVNAVGGTVNVTFFPYRDIKVGLFLNCGVTFPVGYTGSDGTVSGYTSYKFDLRTDVQLGLCYYYIFPNSLGIYLEAGGEYSWYRIAETNEVNQKEPGVRYRFGEFSFVANLGMLSVYKKSFFRLYITGSYSPFLDDPGFRVGLGAGGGFIF